MPQDQFDQLWGMAEQQLDGKPPPPKAAPQPAPPPAPDPYAQLISKHARYGFATAEAPNVVPAARLGISHADPRGRPLAAVSLEGMSDDERAMVFQRMDPKQLQVWQARNQQLEADRERQAKLALAKKLSAWMSEYRHRKAAKKEMPEGWDEVYAELKGLSINDLYAMTRK